MPSLIAPAGFGGSLLGGLTCYAVSGQSSLLLVKVNKRSVCTRLCAYERQTDTDVTGSDVLGAWESFVSSSSLSMFCFSDNRKIFRVGAGRGSVACSLAQLVLELGCEFESSSCDPRF